MPYSEANAPDHIPEGELVEALLSEKRPGGIGTVPLQDLTPEQRAITNLVKLGERNDRIKGDPYGVLAKWSGNVAHPEDVRMLGVLGPVCEELAMLEQRDTEEIRAIQTLLQRIPITEPDALGKEMATDDFEVVRDLPEELVVRFLLHSKTVRLMHAKDLDKGDTKTYDRATRAKVAKRKEEALLDEGKMPIATQQYLMAHILAERKNEFGARFNAEKDARPMDHRKSVLGELRSLAREMYWLDLSQTERADARKEADRMHQSLEPHDELAAIRSCWYSAWSNAGKDVDPFRNYLKDQTAAKSRVWEFVEEDIFVAVDKNLNVVFCNVENIV
ncbi:hypothetical protein DL769_005768 [Monosporascus sp. CRB-8-3]|nr:hypothetical protein DL769_005768 [Monosporascus sp. CRB-8-3]